MDKQYQLRLMWQRIIPVMQSRYRCPYHTHKLNKYYFEVEPGQFDFFSMYSYAGQEFPDLFRFSNRFPPYHREGSISSKVLNSLRELYNDRTYTPGCGGYEVTFHATEAVATLNWILDSLSGITYYPHFLDMSHSRLVIPDNEDYPLRDDGYYWTTKAMETYNEINAARKIQS